MKCLLPVTLDVDLAGFLTRMLSESVLPEQFEHILTHRGIAAQEDVGRRRVEGDAELLGEHVVGDQVLDVALRHIGLAGGARQVVVVAVVLDERLVLVASFDPPDRRPTRVWDWLARKLNY